MDKKPPPHDIEAEEGTLGSILIDAQMLPVVVGILEGPEDFYKSEHQMLFAAILELQEKSVPPDHLTLLDHMDGDYDPVLLSRLIDTTPMSARAEHYAHIVAKKASRRRLIEASKRIAVLAWDETKGLGDVEDESAQVVLDARSKERRQARPMSELVRAYYDRIETLARDNKPLGVPTGYEDLDKILGGFQESDLIYLAARPSTGKSALALNMAHNAAKLGQRVGIFSLEMSWSQVTQRLVALDSAVSTSSLKTGKLMDSEWIAFNKSVNALDGLCIWVDDTPSISPVDLRAKAMQIQATVGLDLLVVDYLQLMTWTGHKVENLRTEVTAISKSLKALARDLDIPVLALSQLSRACEQRADKRPMLSDLRESGALEQDSDVVMFIYRDEMYDPNTKRPNIAEVIVAKHRNGPTGMCSLIFRKALTQFLDAQRMDLNGDLSIMRMGCEAGDNSLYGE